MSPTTVEKETEEEGAGGDSWGSGVSTLGESSGGTGSHTGFPSPPSLAERSRGLLEDARRLYEEALELNPSNSYAVNGLALLAKEPGETRRLLEKAVTLDNVNSYALANLGGELMGLDDRRALQCLDRALLINPRLFYARLHRSKVLLDLGDIDGAILSVQEQLTWQPEDDRAKRYLHHLERHRLVMRRLRQHHRFLP